MQVTNDTRKAPANLMVLHSRPSELSDADIKALDFLDWYQPCWEAHPGFQHLILVSAKLTRDAVELVAAADCGIPKLQAVELIDACLHRWSEEDGFFHA